MRFTGTNKKLKNSSHNRKRKSESRKANKKLKNIYAQYRNAFNILGLCVILLVVAALGVYLLYQAAQPKDRLGQARQYLKQSDIYYQSAIARYRELIKRKEDLDKSYFELGLLYYHHGQFELASEYLSKTKIEKANKYLALSLYKNNDFTEAKDAFRKLKNPDAESLYYYGQVCEKLNLYDQALAVYSRINRGSFRNLAQKQIKLITKLGKAYF